MTPRAVVFDLDGTLAASKAPLEPTMGARLSRLLLKMPVAVMSGGSYQQYLRQFFSGMPDFANFKNLYLFPTSASQCYIWRDGTWHIEYDSPFTDEESQHVLAAFAQALAATGFDKPPKEIWGEQLENRGSQITWSALGQRAPVEEKRVWDPDRSKRNALVAALAPLIPDCLVRMGGSTSIDVTKRGVDKAFGVRKFSELTHIPVAEMLYVGDALYPGGNDEIVTETGIPTEQVTGPEQAAAVIETLLTISPHASNASEAPAKNSGASH